MGFQFTTRPYTFENLPHSKSELVTAAELLTEQVTTTWKKGKCYTHKVAKNPTQDSDKVQVQAYYSNIDGEQWLSRVSKHTVDPDTYQKMIKYLNGSTRDSEGKWQLEDRSSRSRYEIEYIEVLNKVDIASVNDGWVLVNLEYELGKPLSTREFNEWVYPIEPYTKSNGVEQSAVISLVADEPMRDPQNHTHAFYTSIETLQYNYDANELTWIMCTSSDAGGNVPKWLQHATIAKTVTKDVPFFLDWISEQKQ